eukprot:scaffold2591_cov46-Phaeocystis_antarctica.AAC.2
MRCGCELRLCWSVAQNEGRGGTVSRRRSLGRRAAPSGWVSGRAHRGRRRLGRPSRSRGKRKAFLAR